MHYHVVEISLYEAGLCQSSLASDAIPSFRRIELLCACLQAMKSYFEIFFSIPVANYVALSMPSWSHLTYSLNILHLLSSFNHPDWNLAYVRETIDFITVLGRLIEHLDSVNTLVGYGKIDMFSPVAKRMNCIKLYVEGKMTGHSEGNVGSEPGQIPDFEPVPGEEDMADFFQFLDDTWNRDLMEPSEH